MQCVERVAFVLLVSAILAVLTVTLLMLLSLSGAREVSETAVLIRRGFGGVL